MPDTSGIIRQIHAYADLVDAGDFEGIARLLRHARVVLDADGRSARGCDLAGVLGRSVILYEDGTPRTKHLITSIDIDVRGVTDAVATSNYLVLQQIGRSPLRCVVTGKYQDQFSLRTDGNWVWSVRDYSRVDLTGDISQHLVRGHQRLTS